MVLRRITVSVPAIGVATKKRSWSRGPEDGWRTAMGSYAKAKSR